ncbi:MAG: hypothetical protein NTX86_00840 [Candidatus Dependentiae bacterium]|nr:hypothetical protein [Candidatus Dependentiae bacterium]
MMTMKSYRIWAVTLRYLRQSTRDLLVIGDFVFWPLIDVVIWGMMSLWLETPLPITLSMNYGLKTSSIFLAHHSPLMNGSQQ